MSKNILIATSIIDSIQDTRGLLTAAGFNCETVSNGREAQAKIYKQNYDVLIISSILKAHPASDVLKYLKLKQAKTKVLFLIDDASLSEYSDEKLKNYNIGSKLSLSSTGEEIKSAVLDFFHHESWKQVKEGDSGAPSQKQELNLNDGEFVRIALKEFTFDKVAIFDVFVKLSSNRYVKILHRGDKFDRAQLDSLSQSKGIDFLYFLSEQQGVYVNFTNELLEPKCKTGSSQLSMPLIKNVAEKYVNEVYLRGIKPALIVEGKKYAQNVFTFLEKEKDLAQFLKDFAQVCPEKFSQNFLISFFSSMIAKNLDWCTYHSVEKVVFASLLCDIGLQGMNNGIKSKAPHLLDGFEFADYRTHPLISRDIVKKTSGIPSQVDTIIEQHHECNDGSGFPQGLSGIKIYPLAKVVSLSTYFVEYLMKEKCKPIEAIKVLATQKEFLEKQDLVFVKALIKTFIAKG